MVNIWFQHLLSHMNNDEAKCFPQITQPEQFVNDSACFTWKTIIEKRVHYTYIYIYIFKGGVIDHPEFFLLLLVFFSDWCLDR